MLIRYNSKKTEKICTDYDEMKKLFGSRVTANKLAILMTQLKYVSHVVEFAKNPVFSKYRYHELKGDKKGVKSLSIDYSYRMTLIIEIVGTGEDSDEINILEVTNHYGD